MILKLVRVLELHRTPLQEPPFRLLLPKYLWEEPRHLVLSAEFAAQSGPFLLLHNAKVRSPYFLKPQNDLHLSMVFLQYTWLAENSKDLQHLKNDYIVASLVNSNCCAID